MIVVSSKYMLKTTLSVLCFLSVFIALSQPYDAPEKVRASIRNYIDDQFRDNKILHYDYSNLYTHKPKQYLELDSLEQLRDSLKLYNYRSKIPYVDTAIYEKQKEILDYKIRFSYEMEHEFIVEKAENEFELYSFTFFVSHNYIVKDLNVLYKVTLNKRNKDLYYQFVEETPLYPNENTYYGPADKSKSGKIYRMYKNALFMYPESASEILHAGFALMRNVLKYQKINRQAFLKQQAAVYLEERYKLSNYNRYSDFDVIKMDGKEVGYKLYVEFVQPGEENQILAVYLEFDIYGVVLGHEELVAPWDTYFKN